MEFELFEKIMKELSRASRKPVVHLNGFGEPLLDRLLPERIKLAKACRIEHTYIVTNASLIFPETSRKIINSGLDTIEYKGNLEWACVVRDQKELWEARL
jgi:wyosine [tRNA(Phe)-imidazoG37] synthetase (radical SAM superfamily)